MTPAQSIERESESSLAHATPVVFVVDDDASVREALNAMIRCAGFKSEAARTTSSGRVMVCPFVSLQLTGKTSLVERNFRPQGVHRSSAQWCSDTFVLMGKNVVPNVTQSAIAIALDSAMNGCHDEGKCGAKALVQGGPQAAAITLDDAATYR
jgi:hypothetical protein